MEVDDIPQIDANIDYNLIQPINQKRTIAFVNHFLLSTTSFLNNFAASCESRLMHFEYKLQKIEASLLILESQLSSIPDLNNVPAANKPAEVTIDLPEVEVQNVETISEDVEDNVKDQENNNCFEDNGVKASNDPRFSKFFKMLQYGVHPQAVKLKMELEGVDASILDNPNAVIPG